MRLIDADALIEKAYWHGQIPTHGNLYPEGVEAVDVDNIEDAPTIDPVRHGRWIKLSGMMPPEFMGKHFCSLCDGCAPNDFGHQKLSPWCPWCGAKMDGVVNESPDGLGISV